MKKKLKNNAKNTLHFKSYQNKNITVYSKNDKNISYIKRFIINIYNEYL